VDPTNTTSVSEALQSMTREILSRSRLLGIIDAFGLYPEERMKLKEDKLTEHMREMITVTPFDRPRGASSGTDVTAFMVSYTAENPRLAQEVASRLTSLFIEENIRTQGSQATTTAKFLTAQLEEAKKKLDEAEVRLRDFKLKNLGELPQQEQSNLGTLTDLRIQLQSNLSNRSRAQQQRIGLESVLSGNIARLNSDRSALLARFTPKHPEVVKIDGQIEGLQDLLTELQNGKTGIVKPQQGEVPTDAIVAQLRGQVEANLTDTENLTRDEQRLRLEISQYQNRLRLTPVREQELTGVLRDYELNKQDYENLLSKQLNAQLTANLEEQQAGQHFRLVDPPSLPSVPSGPKRAQISLGALAGGLVLGVVLAFLMDLRTKPFHTEKEVKRRFDAPLVVGVPLVRTPAELRKRRVRRVVEWVAVSLMFAVVVAAEVYVVLRSGLL
jgi:polysaccharide biosynthesis transport protein